MAEAQTGTDTATGQVFNADALAGRVALVTGAARGIGRAIALELARAGAAIAVNDVDPGEEAEAAVEEITGLGCPASVYQADVSDRAAVERMVAAVAMDYGRFDVLINNAGMQLWESFLEITAGPLQRTLDVDLKGVLLCAQAAARRMVAQGDGGRIINISSVHAIHSITTAAVYGAAKAGVVRLTATLALELARYGITCNAIGPGWMDTALSRCCDVRATRTGCTRYAPKRASRARTYQCLLS